MTDAKVHTEYSGDSPYLAKDIVLNQFTQVYVFGTSAAHPDAPDEQHAPTESILSPQDHYSPEQHSISEQHGDTTVHIAGIE
eukprot:4050222-Amphidinium_carterae.1